MEFAGVSPSSSGKMAAKRVSMEPWQKLSRTTGGGPIKRRTALATAVKVGKTWKGYWEMGRDEAGRR